MSESTPACAQGKVCIKCGKFKPHSEYGSRGKDRIRNDCKACVAAYQKARYQRDAGVRARHKVLRDRWRAENPNYLREYYLANRESMIVAAIEYAKVHPVDPERRRARDRARYCATRDQRRAVDKAWREANLELVREKGRRGQHRRRARMRGLPSSPYNMAGLIARDGVDCVLCGDELDLIVVYPEDLAPTVEHLECISWPDSAGDVPSNVALSHWGCNNRRRDKPHLAAARKRAELLAAEQGMPA